MANFISSDGCCMHIMFLQACLSGNINIIEQLITKVDPNIGMRNAGTSGNQDVIDLLIKYGATNLREALIGAGIVGNLNMIDKLIDLGVGDLDYFTRKIISENFDKRSAMHLISRGLEPSSSLTLWLRNK